MRLANTAFTVYISQDLKYWYSKKNAATCVKCDGGILSSSLWCWFRRQEAEAGHEARRQTVMGSHKRWLSCILLLNSVIYRRRNIVSKKNLNFAPTRQVFHKLLPVQKASQRKLKNATNSGTGAISINWSLWLVCDNTGIDLRVCFLTRVLGHENESERPSVKVWGHSWSNGCPQQCPSCGDSAICGGVISAEALSLSASSVDGRGDRCQKH